MSTKLEKLIREIRTLQAERDLARSIAHDRGIDAGELEAEIKELRDLDETWAETVEEWKDLYKLLEAQNRQLREALQQIVEGPEVGLSMVAMARRALEDKP